MTKILVIEDDINIRESIFDTLEFAGYDVELAQDGNEGVEKAKQLNPHLILCDIMMPVLDGYGVLEKLYHDPKTFSIPFIFLTAKAAQEDVRRGMLLGADDYLTKPFEAQTLLDAVQSRLERNKLLSVGNTVELEELRDYFNLTLSHELRTPLTGILGFLELLIAEYEALPADKAKEMLQHIQVSAKRLEGLVEAFFCFAKLLMIKQNDAIQEQMRSFNGLRGFEVLIEQVAMREAMGANRLADLRLDLSRGDVKMFHDFAEKLVHAIVNNAFKFSAPGTAVSITSSQEAPYYVLRVTNEGRGLTEGQIEQFQANRQFERKRFEQQGVGLGVATAQLILDIYEGKLEICSVPNEIITFTIYLKLCGSSNAATNID